MRQIIVYVSDTEKEPELLCKAFEAFSGVDRVEMIEIENEEPEPEKLYIVRLYDGMDHEWMDITAPMSKAEAEKVWNEQTNNGTQKTKYGDIDYYKVYPADTRMAHSGS